jgi:hypothetical protein
MRSLRFSVRGIAISIIFFGVAVILFYYRRGGVVDSIYSSAPGFRDVGIYIRAAQDVLAQRNPYESSDLSFRSGFFGVLPFALLGHGALGFLISQVLNLLGFAYFVKVMLGDRLNDNLILILLSVGIWFSSLREVFSTGQITGILAGLCAIGFKSLASDSNSKSLISAISFAIILDLKPNLFVFFVLSCYLFHGKLKKIWLPGSIVLIGHVSVDIYTNSILERDWLEVLRVVNNSSSDPSSIGTKTFWSLVTNIFGLDAVSNVLPTISFVVVGALLLFLLRNYKDINIVCLSLSVPFFYNYFYLYSFTPVAFLLIGVSLLVNSPTLIGLALPLLLFSGPHFGLLHLLAALGIGFYFIFILRFSGSLPNPSGFGKLFLISFGTALLLRIGIEFLIQDSFFRQVLVLNFLIATSFYVHLKDFFKGQGVPIKS